MVTAARLRRRRLASIAGYILLLALVAAAGLDRFGHFGYRGDDWSRFDRRSARSIDVLDGDTFIAAAHGTDERVTVRLLGVDAPELPTSHWSDQAKTYLSARLADRDVILRLDGTQTRDAADGHLLAMVYITDGDCLNVDIVRDGQAFVDRRVRQTMRSPMEQAERDARTKQRGMWREMTDEQMPAWRRQWLRSLPGRTQTDSSKRD
jgi:endonuclease YncB( thermonuclease family)